MEKLKEKIESLVRLMGFGDFRVECEENSRRVSLHINDGIVSEEILPAFVLNLERVARLIAKHLDEGPVVVDINNYRREREGLIIKLARAAARKAATTGEAVALPIMNAYERRLVHTELSMRPDVLTESTGETDRHVVVKPIEG
ncbi:MAG: hypothetical protein HYS89_01385 [Candidatus Colwellbacteria bacterium]|nr:hypothetical protein [Candidatus Colwellbacteria bacterium]